LKKEAKTFAPGPGRLARFATPWRGTRGESFWFFFQKELFLCLSLGRWMTLRLSTLQKAREILRDIRFGLG
jgi:hypothetical protein